MTITPPDAKVAAQSFPRRWRALFATAAGDPEMTDVLARSGAEDLAAQATDVLDATAAHVHSGLASRDAGDVLDRLESAATHLAASIDVVPPDEWQGPRIEALDAGIERAAALLREAERAIEAARAGR
jgi:hypothetical protein